MSAWIFLPATFLLLVSIGTSAAVIRVPAEQPTIQAGIDAATDGDTVVVADGTYSGPGNWDMDFLGKAITVQSENGRFNCSINLQMQDHYAFSFHSAEGGDSVLRGFTISDAFSTNSGGAIRCVSSSPRITGNRFHGNLSSGDGGAICLVASDASIHGNSFASNSADAYGGAVDCQSGSRPNITNCSFQYNTSEYGGAISARGGSKPRVLYSNLNHNMSYQGGAVYAAESDTQVVILCSVLEWNRSSEWGGAVMAFDSGAAEIMRCQLDQNDGRRGGGIGVSSGGEIHISFSTLAANEAVYGGGICVYSSTLEVENSIVWGNTASVLDPGIWLISGMATVSYSCIQDGWAGTGNISEDPLFCSGSRGNHYLSQTSSGQPENSPCVDAADPSSTILESTTQTRHEPDTGRPDMGYHAGLARLALGPGPSYANPPRVRVWPPDERQAVPAHEFDAYSAPHFGVNVACGDFATVGSFGTDEIITGPGPGEIYGPHVRGFRADGTPLPGLSFLAYGTQEFGVNVAAGELMIGARGQGVTQEIITGPGPGPVFGPHVRAFVYDEATASVRPMPGVSFFAYGTHKYGVNVAAGDINGDSYSEIVTGPGPGAVFGPHVRGWKVESGVASPIPEVSFFAYGTHKFGVNVTCGDVDNDGIDELVTAPGPGSLFAAHVRGWNYDGLAVSALPDLNFFAWPPGQARYGARVFAGADLCGWDDGGDDIVVGCGPDPSVETPVKIFWYTGGEAGVIMVESFDATFPAGYTRGTSVAAGRL